MAAKSLTIFGLNAFSRFLRSERTNYPRSLAVFGPNLETVNFARSVNARNIAEMGIYEGHTSREFAHYLNNSGELHLYDFDDRATAVRDAFIREGFSNVRAFGSSYKLLDSYNWQLGKIIEQTNGPIYDYVFIDGAHTFAVDALTFFLADRLLKIGGHIDFDDYDWTLADSLGLSPRRFPLTAKLYTQEQIETRQVKMIIEALVRKSGRYSEVIANKVFQKTG
jgi:hypothetical protein